MNESPWYKNAVFYQVYVRAFKDSNGDGQGDLPGVTEKLDYLKDLGVDCLWLMPIYPSPQRDDGYDVADYCSIASVFGTIDDLKALIHAAHVRGMRLIMDLVMNHTSAAHPWFQAARADRNSPYRDYYVWSDTDRKYKSARIIFVDTEPSNWTWDEQAGQFYWHRFYASQPDLNYDNPKVQEEMLNIVSFWLELGIDGFRADAVPYLFEREGTNCENLPETHAYLRKVRALIDKSFPDRMLLCEANQGPDEVRSYFGNGDEFHMGFHFPIMPRIFMALKKGRSEDLREILRRTPSIPDNCQWCTFLRNHDELTLEMVTPEERQWMWDHYAPEPRMRINRGIRRRLAPLLDNDPRKIKLANSLLLTLPGSPTIYYGDEIGMGDNIWLEDRQGVRTPMQWSGENNAGFSSGPGESLFAPVINEPGYDPARVNVTDEQRDEASLLNSIRHMLHVRKRHLSLGWGALEWLDQANPEIAAFRRTWREERILAVHNLSENEETLRLDLPEAQSLRDLLSGQVVGKRSRQFEVELSPHQYLWLEQKP